MSKKLNGVNHSMSVKVKTRRQGVIKRLESQLALGHKPNKDKNCAIGDSALPLTEFDIKRINSEIQTLKARA
jgi:hypothetical protein